MICSEAVSNNDLKVGFPNPFMHNVEKWPNIL